MALTSRRLLQQLDPLAFPDRQRLLARVARESESTELDGLLDELAAGDEDGQRLGLRLATTAHHTGYVTRCLDYRGELGPLAAAAAVLLDVPPEEFVSRIRSWPTVNRRTVYRAVRRHCRVDTAEALLPIVRETFGDVEAAAVLPACTAGTVAAQLPDLGYAVTGWAGLGQRHPAVVLDHVEAELTRTPHAGWDDVLRRVSSALGVAAATHPGRVLDVLERIAGHASIPAGVERRLASLARHDPDRVLGLLLDPRRAGRLARGRALWRALLGVDDGDLAHLGRAVGAGTVGALLHVVPPARRPAVFDAILGGRDFSATGIPLTALDELPMQARVVVARRALGERSIAEDPELRLAVTARLPWTDSEPVLRTATHRSEADDRAEAYPLYVTAAAGTREPAVVEQAIASLTRLPNEQEPVRAPALDALARIPAWMITDAAARAVVELATAAASARDSSWLTQQAVRSLADRVVVESSVADRPALLEAGIALIDLLGRASAAPNLAGLDRGLPRGAERRVFAALSTRIESDARRGEYWLALALADGLGRRAWNVPGLQAVLDRARRATDDQVVRRAIGLWLGPPATRDERVAAVLRADRSTITIDAVRRAVGWRRTDLLDEVFGRSLHGRFLTRGVRHIPWFHNCFERWLPRQRNRYVELLLRSATSTVAPWERARAVGLLGTVPAGPEVLRPFLTDPEVSVRDAALAAVARVRDPSVVLPDLLAHADGDRAHVAMSCAGRCVRSIPPSELAAALSPAMRSRKVTARKEAVRLLAEHHSPEALSVLEDVWSAPQQHRDVRRAVVSALRWLLDEPRAWDLLAEAGASSELYGAVLAMSPGAVPVRHRPRYAELIRGVAASSDEDTAQRGLVSFTTWVRWDTAAGTELLVRLVTDLGATATWRRALQALVAAAEYREQEDGPVRAVTLLLSAPEPAASTDRDQPVRQRLDAMAVAVDHSVRFATALRPVAVRLAGLLTEDYRDIAIRLAVTGIDWRADDRGLAGLRRVSEMADRPVLAADAAAQVGSVVPGVLDRIEPADVEPVARSLVDGAGLLAAAIARVAGERAGWPPEWRTLVQQLRADADPDVRVAAARIVMVRE